ncbi:MAG: hypothetical protein KIS92_25250, partial [Planctomycetota bacterium]|nr:hypothetical protein [Planctomycetota bacterium]
MLRVLFALLAVGVLAPAVVAAEKDKPKQGRADDETGALHVTWYPSVAAAVDVAKANYVPVMVLIFREGNKDDLRRVENVEGWPTIIQASHEQMAATKLSDQNEEAKAIVQRLQLKRLPAVVWLDRDANPVIATAFTDSAATMTAVIQGWGQTLDTIAKFYSKHLIAGNKYLARGRLRSAYLEYSFLAPFQGKDPDLARRGQDRVREAWLKTLAKAKELPPESVERVVIVKGLRRDVQFLDFSKTLEEEINRAPQVAAERPRPAAPP